MHEARIELLQRMSSLAELRTEVLQFLLGLCPIVSVPAIFQRRFDVRAD